MHRGEKLGETSNTLPDLWFLTLGYLSTLVLFPRGVMLSQAQRSVNHGVLRSQVCLFTEEGLAKYRHTFPTVGVS